MKKTYTHIKGVFIAEPCHANWDEMTEVEKGRYCNHCSKIVYDFTNADPTEFFRMYKEAGGNMCGNFYAHPSLFERLRTQTSLLFADTKVAVLSIALSLGLLLHKGAKGQACPPKYDVADSIAANHPGFVTISVELRKENKNNLLKEEFSVEIIFDTYTAKLNKVTEGTAYFQVPAELVGTEATIIIKGNRQYFYYSEKHTITTEGVKAELDKKSRKEMKRRKYRQLRGCISF